MMKSPNLRCLVLSLLDDDCLGELIENKNLPRLFYDHEIMFFIEGDDVKVDKLQFKEGLEEEYYDPLRFSELSESRELLGEYQLEKGSIIWKIKIKDVDKQKVVPEEDHFNR